MKSQQALASIDRLLTKKFSMISVMELSNLVVTEPISIPYNQLQYGNSLKEFQQHPVEFSLFRNKYPTSVDQLLFLARNLELSKTTLQSLDENLNNFKEHL